VAAAVVIVAYTVNTSQLSASGRLLAGNYCRRHRHAVGGHVYMGVSMCDQYDASSP
jgi:hypothetical protein